ncbi:MAG TPA: substrate-binding domain-containing protein, partial [Thermoguttaceae bacterium]|nr:substrate-binding domain-containing protein [Thermoguttaceae bacterium]
LRVVLPDPDYSTCGKMVLKRLEEAGIKDAVLENVGNQLVRDHAMVGNQLKLGAADAGIMWNGVANIFKDDLIIISDPYAYEEIKLSVMGLSYSKNQEQLEQFLDFVEEYGPQVFKDFGYVK